MAAIIEALVSRTFLPMTFTGCGPSCRSTSNTAKSERASPNADTLLDAFSSIARKALHNTKSPATVMQLIGVAHANQVGGDAAASLL